jgi:nuclear GTP-binding protein
VEEKERRKAEKKNAKAIAHGEVIEDARPRPVSEQENDDTKEEKEEREEEVPILINRDLPTLQSVLEKADVILEVLDARDPMVFRSEHVEQLVKDAGKKMLLVLNKIGDFFFFFFGRDFWVYNNMLIFFPFVLV